MVLRSLIGKPAVGRASTFILFYWCYPPHVPLHCDNKGAVDLAVNPVTGRRSKHIPIRHHVIREYVERGDITLIRTPTLEMLADGFTKSLPKATLMRHAYDMGQVLPGRSDDAPS